MKSAREIIQNLPVNFPISALERTNVPANISEKLRFTVKKKNPARSKHISGNSELEGASLSPGGSQSDRFLREKNHFNSTNIMPMTTVWGALMPP